MKKIEYYIIHRWMRDDLKLSGTELECYAVIYGFSMGENKYIAGNKGMMELLHKSEPSIIAALKSLTEKGLIEKDVVCVDSVNRNYYSIVDLDTLKNLSTPPLKKFKYPHLKKFKVAHIYK